MSFRETLAAFWNKVNALPPTSAKPQPIVAQAPVPAPAQSAVNPLSGKPLSYLIGADAPVALLGRVVEVGYDTAKPAGEPCIAYCNLFDEKNTGAYGPYLRSSDTASEYNEGQIDPKGIGWKKNLIEQFNRRKTQGFQYVELDNPDAYAVADVVGAVELAAVYGFKVIAKNPLLLEGDPLPYVQHPAVVACIVERGGGSPDDMDKLRKRAGKPDLPVWFVAFGDGRAWAGNTANQAKQFEGMGVTYSSVGEYGNSIDIGYAPAAAPPSTPAPTPAPIPQALTPVNTNFARCVKLVLVHEGGNDDDPRDPGGRTSRGIIQTEWTEWRKSHPGLPSDVWQAPQDQVEAIYKQKYWDALDCDQLPAGVDYAVFDYGVNSGIGRSALVLQRCALVRADGKIGPNTIAAVQRRDARELVNQICDERLSFLRGLSTWGTFGRGWTARVTEVRRDALAMLTAPAPAPQPLPPIIEPPKPVPAPDSPELHNLGHRIKRTMLAKGYPWFADQNVVSVEGMDPDGTVNKNRPNAFDDIKCVIDGDGKIIGGPWEGTTQPSVYWTTHPMADGGAFIIALGPQACWTPGPYHDHTVWRQAEDSTIMGTRDPNCTYKRQGLPIKHGAIGVHHHGGYDLPRDNIANAAAGCQVIRSTKEQQSFMDLTMKCPRYLADKQNYRLTATVLEAKDVLP